MKKILIVVLILLFLAGAGLAWFVATFDAERYRPFLESQLTQALGNPVRIRAIKLDFGPGLVLKVRGFEVREREKPAGEPVLVARSLDANLRLLPLLLRKIEMGSVSLLAPRVHLIRSADGALSVAGIRTQATGDGSKTSPAVLAGPSSGGAGPGVLSSVSLGRFELKNGEIRIEDRGAAFPVDTTVRNIDIVLTQVALNRNIGFKGVAAIFGSAQNLTLEGSVKGLGAGRPFLNGIQISANLNKVDPDQLLREAPMAARWGLRAPVGGLLKVGVDELELDGARITKLKAEVDFSGGTFGCEKLPSPVTGVRLNLGADLEQISIRRFEAEAFGGLVSLRSKTTGYLSTPSTEGELSVKEFRLGALLALSGHKPHLDGKFSVDFRGSAQGRTADVIRNTLSGAGNFELKEGVILNKNPLKDVLDKISAIPEFGQGVRSQLSPQVLARIESPVTPIVKPLQSSFQIHDGRMDLNRLEIPTELFTVVADTSVELTGAVDAQGVFYVGPQVSQAISAGVQDGGALADQNGLISIPVKLRVSSEGTQVRPDLSKFGAKFLAAKGQALIGNLLQKAMKKSGTASSAD